MRRKQGDPDPRTQTSPSVPITRDSKRKRESQAYPEKADRHGKPETRNSQTPRGSGER